MIEEIIRAKPAAAKGRYILSITVTATMGPGGCGIDPSRTRRGEIMLGSRGHRYGRWGGEAERTGARAAPGEPVEEASPAS